jgi:molybdenum cofactor biosynthesis enzyme
MVDIVAKPDKVRTAMEKTSIETNVEFYDEITKQERCSW